MSKQSEGRAAIHGSILIGAADTSTAETFQARNAVTGAPLEPPVSAAGPAEVDAACALADEAFPRFSETDPEARARFLEAVADAVTDLGAPLIERAMAE